MEYQVGIVVIFIAFQKDLVATTHLDSRLADAETLNATPAVR